MLFALLDGFFVTPPDQARVGWLRGVTYAHRGLHGAGSSSGVPENSPTGFALAIERGLGIECDVQRTADGQAVVFHDWELDRLTGQPGAVLDLRMDQLTKIGLSGSDDCIPTLREFLTQVAGRVPVLIELKSRRELRAAPLCLAVRRALEGYRGPVAVMSFDPRVSRWFARYSPHIVHGLVVTENGSRTLPSRIKRRLAFWQARPQFLAWDIRDLPSKFAATQRKRGFPLLTWTVRSAELAARAADCADGPIAEGAGLGA